MKQFWVEGLVLPKGAGRSKKSTVKPFSQSFWANTPQEAIQMAFDSIPGGQWVDGPSVSTTSEEQRMRALGAPELPGMGSKSPARKINRK